MKTRLSILLILVLHIHVKAQNPAEADIKKTIATFFEAMYTSDTLLMQSIMHKTATLNSVNLRADKPSTFDNTPMAAMYRSIGTKRPGIKLEERLLDHKISIDQDLAIDWTPYQFYVNEKLSHSGTNVFTLVKLDSKWLITAIIDTRKR